MLDYEEIAEGRLTNQFQDSPKLKSVVRALVSPFSDVENLADQVKGQRWIDSAIGVQLDGAGYIVGEPRIGRSDDDYRIAILFKIFVNTSNATPEDLIRGLRFLTSPDDIQYMEQYPATAMLYTDGQKISPSIHDVMQGLAPAAISDVPIMVSFSWKSPFRFSRIAQPGELFVNNDSSYLQANGSDIQVQVGSASSGPRLGGLAASDLDVGGNMLQLDSGATLALNVSNYDVVIESGYHLVGVYQ